MLAFMPQPPPQFDVHTQVPEGRNTMSLAILPSAPYLESPSPSKRPKLTLNTSNVTPIFGKGSTSLRLETLSATSPTARNTFRNGQDRAQSTSSSLSNGTSTTEPTASTDNAPQLTPSRIELPTSADASEPSPTGSIDSVSTVDSLPSEIPYRLPFNARSILSNGPIPRTHSRKMSFAQSRPMFPAAKKVTFRAPLTEDIKNSKYTLRHSDIESSSCGISSTTSEDTKRIERNRMEPSRTETTSSVEAEPTSPQTCNKRESEEDDDDNDTCPATPIAGRRKRHRQWVWTLDPVGTSASNDS